jgi:hypothetical protein
VEVGLGVTDLLGETKVNDIDLVTALPNAHQEVILLDVTMYEIAGVDILDARNLSKRVSEESRKLEKDTDKLVGE